MHAAEELARRARNLEKSHDFAEAATLYREAFELAPACFVATRRMHCLRRQGQQEAREAARFGREVASRYLEDLWFRREYVWSIYDGYLKRALQAPDADVYAEGGDDGALVVRAALRILELTDEEMPRRLAVFAACREAKVRGRWDEVLQLATQLDGASLSRQSQVVQGRSIPSDHERWLNLLARASFETERLAESLLYCEQGMAQYPRGSSFVRTRALVLLAQGKIAEALRLLEEVDRKFAPQWFVKADIARCHAQAGRLEQAVLKSCEAALVGGDRDGRITLLGEMAGYFEQQGELDAALMHRVLCWSLAAHNRWERRASRELQEVVRLQSLVPSGAPGQGSGDAWSAAARVEEPRGSTWKPPSVREALAPCQELWTTRVRIAHPQAHGVIKMYDAGRGFGFIAEDVASCEDGGGSLATRGKQKTSFDLHFRRQAFKGSTELLRPGTRVRFVKKPSFDAKKGVESLSAVDVRPLEPLAKQGAT